MGRGCRVCGKRANVQAAHVLGRAYDKPKDPGNPKTLWVNPDCIVPLCQAHHALYDNRQFDILPYLTREEEVAAVRVLGMYRAFKRVSSGILPQ